MLKGKVITDKEKEHDKFNEIYHVHGGYLFRIGMSILKNESYAEEALQRCLIKIYKNIDKIGIVDAKETRSYISIIMEHACISVQRKIKIESNKLVTESVEEALYIMDEDADVEEIFAKAELGREIQKYLDELKEDAKQLIYLKYLRGYSNKELAEIFDVSQDTIRQRDHRAREKLKEIIEKKRGGRLDA